MKNKETNIKISVVVPTFNEERSISKLIDALLSQSFLPDEIIICDKHSTDNTIKIVSSYFAKHNNIKIINRIGLCRGAGRNEGIQHSKNEYIALIDAGIIPDKDWLYNFEKNLNTEINYDIIFGSVYFIPNNIFEESYASTFFDKAKKRDYIIPSVASMFMKRSAWKYLGGFPESIDGSYVVEDLRFINLINDSNLSKVFEPKAKVKWIIDLSLKEIFKRFFDNSYGGLKAGFFKTWHLGLVRNLFVISFLIYFAITISNIFYIILIILIPTKSFFYLRFTEWFKKNTIIKKINYLLFTSFIFILIDLSSLLALIKWIFSGFPKIKDKK